uniref:NADH-ubiquinone oxidoreductase chain 2 n=1 Tax=Carcinocoris binghami TaxID=1347739 RepID=A0A342CF86_9HEMI|nr:NADH dehydrogenase subunit 2 [Carcinocoris binghami]AGO28039.1 NADH dehydrogenase subunit 2 [Carcinocoris binghami]
MNTSKILFMTMLILSNLMIMSSENLLGMWMGIEINMMSFIPILFKNKNTKASESCMIYFLAQSMGSILMLMMIVINSLILVTPNWVNELIIIIISISMMIKLGAPPFHFWFPNIMESMEWMEGFILMTWQKVGPLMVISTLINKSYIITPIMISTVIVGAIGGLNQTSMKKIMAYSSISHLGWMIMCMKFNNQLWLTYLSIYTVMIFMLTIMFKFYSSNFLNQMNFYNLSFMESTAISISLLSLGGLPPFIGFLPKWMVIQNMILSNSFFILLIMILTTLITLFFYMRMVMTSFMISYSMPKWYLNKNKNNITNKIMFTNMILPASSILSY